MLDSCRGSTRNYASWHRAAYDANSGLSLVANWRQKHKSTTRLRSCSSRLRPRLSPCRRRCCSTASFPCRWRCSGRCGFTPTSQAPSGCDAQAASQHAMHRNHCSSFRTQPVPVLRHATPGLWRCPHARASCGTVLSVGAGNMLPDRCSMLSPQLRTWRVCSRVTCQAEFAALCGQYVNPFGRHCASCFVLSCRMSL